MKGTITNMKDVSDKPTFEICPLGDHLVEITEMTEKDTKNADLMVMLTLEVVSGPAKGRKIWDNIIICENPDSPAYKMRWRLKQFLKAIGEPHDGDSFEWDTDRWHWRRCMVTVGHEIQTVGKYAGEPRAVVKKYMSADAPATVTAGKDPVFKDSEIPF